MQLGTKPFLVVDGESDAHDTILVQVNPTERPEVPRTAVEILNRLNEIIRGRRGVTADTAWRLSKLLKTSPEFWMNLQVTWELYHASFAHA